MDIKRAHDTSAGIVEGVAGDFFNWLMMNYNIDFCQDPEEVLQEYWKEWGITPRN